MHLSKKVLKEAIIPIPLTSIAKLRNNYMKNILLDICIIKKNE